MNTAHVMHHGPGHDWDRARWTPDWTRISMIVVVFSGIASFGYEILDVMLPALELPSETIYWIYGALVTLCAAIIYIWGRRPNETDAPSPQLTVPAEFHIGRLKYFLIGNVVSAIAAGVVVMTILPDESGLTFPTAGIAVLGPVAMILWVAIMLAITWARLRDIGWTAWLTLAIVVPVVNFYLAWACLACPTRFAQSRKLDTAGFVITGIIVLIAVLEVAISLMA